MAALKLPPSATKDRFLTPKPDWTINRDKTAGLELPPSATKDRFLTPKPSVKRECFKT